MRATGGFQLLGFLGFGYFAYIGIEYELVKTNCKPRSSYYI